MKTKIIKWALGVLIAGGVIGGGTVLYLFNMPHRDIQAADVDLNLSVSALVQEFLTDSEKANTKYLQEEGESMILAVTGTVQSIYDDMNKQKVVVLRDNAESAGVSCTFMASTNTNAQDLKKGDLVTIKGVIRSGAGYDEDLELYEDVIMEKCDIVQISG